MAAALPSLRHMRRLLGGGSALLASCTGHQALPRHTHAQLGNLNELLPSLRSGNMLSLSTARSTSSIGLAAAHQRSQAVCHSHNDVQRNHRSLLSGTSPGALLQGASSSSQGPARTALALPPKPSLQTAASGLITRGFVSGSGAPTPPPLIISPVACRVVVIGWMGCAKRYLLKYGQLWARSGDHEVLLIRPSVMQTLVRWRGVVVAGRDIDRVAAMHRENPAMPTIYHIFSTGGFIHAGTMWRWMDEVEDVAQRRDLLEEVRGIIFDSGPARVDESIASKAMAAALTRTPTGEVLSRQAGLVSTLQPAMRWWLGTRGPIMREEEVYDAWYHLAPSCPQLYLYSDTDAIVPSAEVERYMQVQEGRGVAVSSHMFRGSGHCEHFRAAPHEYAYQISQFLSTSLQGW